MLSNIELILTIHNDASTANVKPDKSSTRFWTANAGLLTKLYNLSFLYNSIVKVHNN